MNSMKIYLSGKNSCEAYYQYNIIVDQLNDYCNNNNNNIITNKIEEADIIIITSSCACHELAINCMVDYIKYIVDHKKKDAKIILTGCLTREFHNIHELQKIRTWLEQEIDYIVPHNEPHKVLNLISNTYFPSEDNELFGAFIYNTNDSSLDCYIQNGCNNACSFCKLTFQYYPVKSVEIEDIFYVIDEVNNYKQPPKTIRLYGMNLAQYGIDLYGKPCLPQVIQYIDHNSCIENIELIGPAFKDIIHTPLKDTIIECSKVSFIENSLESGSNKILSLMDKGITIEEVLDFTNTVKAQHYIDYKTCIIAGFPTETLEDCKRTIEALRKIKPYIVFISKYCDSSFVTSHKYPKLTQEEIDKHADIYARALTKANIKCKILN